ncbi:hypothetical protein SDRG_00889 [Saprolegnia diclina VS20]|uniref:Uncharacterized protein n=1 Tax=Saprolegnia diclina (strain VS20) TaxID=1156394 RepID=T0R521_SAPDV|nr:hypothetical protein SDRG_00889 [Saprolegnia diclina VS20]EQC42046.1 hypothetical protein SDRG_00889 [Saprolegnia diclina VS20]|eukprot:XP_008604615.1 hypothetical protein SDRG_00889 [Saprolegnia diclina VS20]
MAMASDHVIDLVSSSSSSDNEDDLAQARGLDDDVDEPLPVAEYGDASKLLSRALESAIVDLESEESEEDEALPRPPEAYDDDDAYVASQPSSMEDDDAEDGGRREEGEISGDDIAGEDDDLKEKQLHAESLREVLVAQRKADALRKMQQAMAQRKKPKKKKKRKLSADASPHTFVKRQVFMEAPADGFLRVHRHGMVESLPGMYHDASMLPTRFMHPPPYPADVAQVNTGSPVQAMAPPLPPSPEPVFDLESLRKAALSSVGKRPPPIKVEEPVAKMALGPSSLTKPSKYLWTNPQLQVPRKKPLTALSQTIVINLSMDECERARQLVGDCIEPDDPIARLKQKIAAREEALRQGRKSAAPSPESSPPPVASPPSTGDEVELAEANIGRLEERIRELRQRIALKTLEVPSVV